MFYLPTLEYAQIHDHLTEQDLSWIEEKSPALPNPRETKINYQKGFDFHGNSFLWKRFYFSKKRRTWDKPDGKICGADSKWWWHELSLAVSLRAPFGNSSLALEPKLRLPGVYLSICFVRLQNVNEFAPEWYLWIPINVDIFKYQHYLLIRR